MTRIERLILCSLLAGGLLFMAQEPQCAQAQGASVSSSTPAAAKPAAKAKRAAKTKKPSPAPKESPASKTSSAAKARTKQSKEKPKLTQEELLSPYTVSNDPKDAQNATRWFFEPTAVPKAFAAPQDNSALNLHLGLDKVVDPLTGQELRNRIDPNAAKDSLKNLDIKGAMDKVGGKAEVQVEILKF